MFIPSLNSNSILLPKPTVERSTAQAEEMRQQRNQEVRQLIGSTVNNAKAIFAQNTAAGQLTSKMAKTAPVKPVRNSITRSVSQQQQQQQQNPSPEIEKIQQPPQQPQQHSEILDSNNATADAAQTNNNKIPADDQHLEEDDSDPYSTIKRSPYTKAMMNSQNEANGNSQQINHVQTQSVEVQQATTIEQEIVGLGIVSNSKFYSKRLLSVHLAKQNKN